MARFNKSSTAASRTKTINKAGGEAHIQSAELELVSILLTSFVKDQFYRGASETMERVAELIADMPDKKFAAKAAIYARNEFGMRSISHVVAGEIANQVKGEQWTRKFFEQVVRRPDDAIEIFSYFINTHADEYNRKGRKVYRGIPNSLKKGIRDSLKKFDEYQIAKYRGEGKDVSLIDVVNLVTGRHPDLIDTEAIKKLSRGQLTSGKSTWEGAQTQAGQKALESLCDNCRYEYEKVKQAAEKKYTLKNFSEYLCEDCTAKRKKLKAAEWTTQIKEKTIGYFALLRNLRNILQDAPKALDDALKMLVSKSLIKKSLVLPFRYKTALNEIEQLNGKGVRKTLQALSNAVDISCDNVPTFDGETLVVVDDSGSMMGKPIEIASLFAAVILRANPDADYMQFSNDARYVTHNPDDSVISIAKKIEGSCQAGGTSFRSIFYKANRAYDRIIILSDMQGWVGHYTPEEPFRDYCCNYKCNPYVYSFDLAGYGSLQFPQSRVFCLAGFSDKIFDVMSLLEQDREALVNTINKKVKL